MNFVQDCVLGGGFEIGRIVKDRWIGVRLRLRLQGVEVQDVCRRECLLWSNQLSAM